MQWAMNGRITKYQRVFVVECLIPDVAVISKAIKKHISQMAVLNCGRLQDHLALISAIKLSILCTISDGGTSNTSASLKIVVIVGLLTPRSNRLINVRSRASAKPQLLLRDPVFGPDRP